MSRTKKRPYTKSKRFDKSCRSHGGCPYCESNKLHHQSKGILNLFEQLKELNAQQGER